jgi:hypothetical protein
MANVDDATTVHGEASGEHLPVAPPVWVSVAAWVMRAIVRAWIVAMVLLAAAFGGIAVYQFYQTRDQLAEVRQDPGAQPYAVVAYRRELARQIEAYRRDWRDRDDVPAPPARPRLLEEIDMARASNDELRRNAESRRFARPQAQFSAPQ